jgi:hypothetical protein
MLSAINATVLGLSAIVSCELPVMGQANRTLMAMTVNNRFIFLLFKLKSGNKGNNKNPNSEFSHPINIQKNAQTV